MTAVEPRGAGGPLRLAVAAMGTRFEAVLAAPPGADERRLRAAGEEALARVVEEEERLSLFRRDSLVARLNEAAGRPLRVDDEFLDLLELCLTVQERSGGAFDPCVGGWMEAQGHRRRPAIAPRPASAGRSDGWNLDSAPHPNPTPTGRGQLLLDRAARTAALPPGARLDLGAIGKGWALDRAAEVLRGCGVERALLHGGTSTVIALGSPPGRAAWTIAVRGADGTELRRVELCDRALSVSAAHGRVVESAGGAVGHVVDPRTGAAVAMGAVAAVVAASAAWADAWSTAALVLGGAPAGEGLDWAAVFPPASPTTTR